MKTTRRGRLLRALILVGVGTAALLWWCTPNLPPPPTPARLQALTARRDQLQERFRAAVIANGEKSFAQAPRAGLAIGIPTGLTTSIVEQGVTGLFGETTLTLRNLTIHDEGEVKAKVLIGKQTIGAYVLDVRIRKAQGLLRPGKPTLAFGKNKVDVKLPVRLAEGRGEADLRFAWDSKGVTANVVCGDIDVTRRVTGTVVPEDYTFAGSFGIAASGEAIVLQPRFPDLTLRMSVAPSEQAWAVVDDVVKRQRKGCEIALGKLDIKEKLQALLSRGFHVKLPPKMLKPITLPAGVRQSVEIQGSKVTLHVKTAGISVDSDRVWYAADLSVGSKRR